MSCGGSVSISLYCMDGKTLKQYGVHGIVTRSETLGRAIREVKKGAGTPEENFLKATEGYRLLKGKITDVLREVRGAFNIGKVIFEGIGEYKGQTAFAEFQNENLLAAVDGNIVATTPDLICMVDMENFIPVPTDALKYGKRVMMVGLKRFQAWLSVPLIAFGYGLHPVGLKTMLRCFDNGAVEGIDVDWYISDVAYDSEDFPYYDGIENEDDEFWKSINITELI